MRKCFVLIFISLMTACAVHAQELNCTVSINSEKITNTNKRVFTSMQKDIQDFLNGHRWSSYKYQQKEKIECTFAIIITEQTDEKTFKGTLQIQARRPVFNSTYYTPIFSFKDENFNFEYIEMNPLEYVDGTFTDNLVDMLAFYAYIIDGYDEDSFSKLGGTDSFNKAERIATMAQSRTEKGWKAYEDDRNRYALVNSILDNNLKTFRDFFYTYHRLGLDQMADNAAKGSNAISSAISVLKDANQARPSCVVLSSFIESKRDEVVNIFSKAPADEKKSVYEVMVNVDPSQASKYETILKNN